MVKRAFTLKVLVIVGSLAQTAVALAQTEVQVTMQALPREVRVGETFQLEVRAKATGGNIDDLRIPDLSEFEIVSRQISRPMQISFGSRARFESTSTYSFRLRALREGTFKIRPARATSDGKTFKSESITIHVRPGLTGNTAAQQPDMGLARKLDDPELSGAQFDDRAFLRTVVEPETAFASQRVNVTVYLYSRLRMVPHTLVPTKPAMDGFWVHDIPLSTVHGWDVIVGGQQYLAYIIHQSVAFPQRSGALTIGAPKVVFNAQVASRLDPSERVEREGVPVTIEIKPLPGPGPADAAVGQYQLRSTLDRSEVRTGNAVTLRVEATGRGSVQDLNLDLPPIPGVRALQPLIRDEQELDGQVLGGRRTWEWILIAESPGAHEVPSLQIQYFDPASEEWEVTQTSPLSFVATGAATASPAVTRPSSGGGSDSSISFGPIRTTSTLNRTIEPVHERWWFAWLLGLPPLFFLVVLAGAGVSRERQRRKSTTSAKQRDLLNESREALQRNDPRAFYDRIVAAITHALDARLGHPVGGLPHAELRKQLQRAGLDADLVDRVITELEGADFARFASSSVSAEDMGHCLERTVAIVEGVQRSGG